MSSRNDEIRRQLGSSLPIPQQDRSEMVFSVRVIPAGDQRKQQDEQCDGDASTPAAADVVTLYFDSLDEARAWWAGQRARRERS